MKCENCQVNEATAYIKTNINGEVHEYHLCNECAAQFQSDNEFGSLFNFDSVFNPMSSFDLVSGLLSSPFGGFGGNIGIASGKRCSCCGSDFNSIAKSGKAGCPKCYSEFRAKFAPTLRKIHGNTVHSGKHSRVTAEQNAENEIKSLKKQLADAVSSENYELAAELRDKINAMGK